MYAALNGQCIKMPLFIFFSFASLPIMAIITLRGQGKERLFLLRWAAFLHVCSRGQDDMLNFLFHFFLWYRLLYVGSITFLTDAWNYIYIRTYLYIYTHTYLYYVYMLFIYTHIQLHTYIYSHTHYVSICIYTNTCPTHSLTHTHTHTYIYTNRKSAFFNQSRSLWRGC